MLNRCIFQKKMLSKLACVLIYPLIKCVLEDGSNNIVKFAEIYPRLRLLLRKLQYLEFLNEGLSQICLFGNL